MKAAKGKYWHKLKKPIGMVESICLKHQGNFLHLTYEYCPQIERLHKQQKKVVVGIPMVCAYDPTRMAIGLFPAPEKAMDLNVRFYPPMDEQ